MRRVLRLYVAEGLRRLTDAVTAGRLRLGLLTADEEQADAPYVCPGCHAVGSELCAAWCPDAELERERGASELDDAYDDDGAEYCWACGDRLEDGNCDSCADAAVPS